MRTRSRLQRVGKEAEVEVWGGCVDRGVLHRTHDNISL